MEAIGKYSTFVFDCDGVILDSNRVKTNAFRISALPWGESAAEALVNHHVAHGGVSRYEKFTFFLENILPQHAPDSVSNSDGPGLDDLLATYADVVRDGLMTCAITEGLAELRAETEGARWLIVSGGDQSELREIFAARDLAKYFDGGIFGSPDTKDEILEREITTGCITRPALFLGDSKYDQQAAATAGLDFIFVHGWTEVADWQDFVASVDVPSVGALRQLAM